MSVKRVRLGRLPLVLGALAAAILLAAWLISPQRYLSGLRVESVRVLQPGEADGSRKPEDLATPERIEVIFSTPPDLVAYRAKYDLPFINAHILACNGAEGRNKEVITQRAGYFSDYGRVRALGRVPGINEERCRYKAVFDDQLTRNVNHHAQEIPARTVSGGLCFKLEGGGMTSGGVRSDQIPLVLRGR